MHCHPHPPLRRSVLLGIIASATLISGCASVADQYQDPRDPWQGYNRAMFRFNHQFDRWLLKPLAKGYQAVSPAVVDRSISNVFANLADVPSAINNLLQFKLARASTDLGRVAVNSTVGVAGIFDVATNLGVPSYKEDLGQTFGYWGMGTGPYLVLPVLGPSNVRDSIGFAIGTQLHPLTYLDSNWHWGGVALHTVDRRADLLSADAVFDSAALDRYSFLRDAYLQRRKTLVYDGNPPESSDEAMDDAADDHD
ncbi:VacJ family lipoprotein [Rhodoferax sp. 4810]|uniref:VacJ family lipoprotein n=1 Tax=Thiospirillum jenense TaxID=1653858 RepID=A0A839HCE6_9GAMM|nr:VacJ family lipoprotein [Thiospirillum jenense]MBB1076284.1 VacJ family lipoprotein [Rhodoferax jenense]MBB1124877.1 VacJ family lipoprotein [Thiospirillum jenense]